MRVKKLLMNNNGSPMGHLSETSKSKKRNYQAWINLK